MHDLLIKSSLVGYLLQFLSFILGNLRFLLLFLKQGLLSIFKHLVVRLIIEIVHLLAEQIGELLILYLFSLLHHIFDFDLPYIKQIVRQNLSISLRKVYICFYFRKTPSSSSFLYKSESNFTIAAHSFSIDSCS